jgi:hypothetical protein
MVTLPHFISLFPFSRPDLSRHAKDRPRPRKLTHHALWINDGREHRRLLKRLSFASTRSINQQGNNLFATACSLIEYEMQTLAPADIDTSWNAHR